MARGPAEFKRTGPARSLWPLSELARRASGSGSNSTNAEKPSRPGRRPIRQSMRRGTKLRPVECAPHAAAFARWIRSANPTGTARWTALALRTASEHHALAEELGPLRAAPHNGAERAQSAAAPSLRYDPQGQAPAGPTLRLPREKGRQALARARRVLPVEESTQIAPNRFSTVGNGSGPDGVPVSEDLESWSMAQAQGENPVARNGFEEVSRPGERDKEAGSNRGLRRRVPIQHDLVIMRRDETTSEPTNKPTPPLHPS